jgi:hypothetical protein
LFYHVAVGVPTDTLVDPIEKRVPGPGLRRGDRRRQENRRGFTEEWIFGGRVTGVEPIADRTKEVRVGRVLDGSLIPG